MTPPSTNSPPSTHTHQLFAVFRHGVDEDVGRCWLAPHDRRGGRRRLDAVDHLQSLLRARDDVAEGDCADR